MIERAQSDSISPSVGPRCIVIRARLWTLLDGECAAGMRDVLQRHLGQCRACDAEYRVMSRFKLLISTSCRRDVRPKG